jgi:hypothetical protein
VSDDLSEVVELEEAAAWRLRQLDAHPGDCQSAAAAALLQHLAEDLRGRPDLPGLTELHALCNWLAESDAVSDYAAATQAYRMRIGVDQHPADAQAYVRALLELARQAM